MAHKTTRLLPKADQIAQLYKLTEEVLPATLKFKLLLPNIKRIHVYYCPESKQAGPIFKFLRKYGPDIRYHNPSLLLDRNRDPEGPLAVKVEVYSTKEEEPILMEVNKMKTPEEVTAKLLQING